MAVPDFPNMFLIYGPNTNLNHNSIITMLEIQQRYVVEALRAGAGAGRGAERQTAGVCPLQRALAGGHDHVGVFRQLLQLVQERGGQGHQQLVGTADQYQATVRWNADDYLWLRAETAR